MTITVFLLVRKDIDVNKHQGLRYKLMCNLWNVKDNFYVCTSTLSKVLLHYYNLSIFRQILHYFMMWGMCKTKYEKSMN
jgi:uncharacterized protein (UPF0262 family)